MVLQQESASLSLDKYIYFQHLCHVFPSDTPGLFHSENFLSKKRQFDHTSYLNKVFQSQFQYFTQFLYKLLVVVLKKKHYTKAICAFLVCQLVCSKPGGSRTLSVILMNTKYCVDRLSIKDSYCDVTHCFLKDHFKGSQQHLALIVIAYLGQEMTIFY